MPATLKLVGVEITKIDKNNPTQKTTYTGSVKLRAEDGALLIEYSYYFVQTNSIDKAIENAASSLKGSLQALVISPFNYCE